MKINKSAIYLTAGNGPETSGRLGVFETGRGPLLNNDQMHYTGQNALFRSPFVTGNRGARVFLIRKNVSALSYANDKKIMTKAMANSAIGHFFRLYGTFLTDAMPLNEKPQGDQGCRAPGTSSSTTIPTHASSLCSTLFKENNMRSFISKIGIVVFTLSLAACSGMTTQQRNTAVGAAVGGVAGSVLTGGNTAATVGGAVVGGVIGHEVQK